MLEESSTNRRVRRARARSGAGAAALAISLGTVGGAAAQTPFVVDEDAFGKRIGLEQVGLYNEAQARGFDLTASNAYRVNDDCFVRAAALSDTIAESVGVKVEVAAAEIGSARLAEDLGRLA
jgi:iron complex outermembrane receptor protein